MLFHFTDGNYKAQEAQGVTHSPRLFFFFLSFSVKIHFQLLSYSEIPRFVKGFSS